MQGAAHPRHWTKVLNCRLSPVLVLRTRDFFWKMTDWTSVLSELCISSLVSQLTRDSDDESGREWIKEGASPEEENFEKMNLTPHGYVFTFDEYSVGSYAIGQQTVEIHIAISPVRSILRVKPFGCLVPLNHVLPRLPHVPFSWLRMP